MPGDDALSAITESARGEFCRIQIPGICNGNPETVVWCHSNRLRHGKGVGKKSVDVFGAYGCSACHDVVDRRRNPPIGMARDEVEDYFQIGHDRSLMALIEKGIVTIR